MVVIVVPAGRREPARRHRTRRQPGEARRQGDEDRRDAQRHRRAADQPLRPAEEAQAPQLLDVDLRVARRGRLSGRGPLCLRRARGLEAQAQPLARRPLREPAAAAGAAARHSEPAAGLRLQRRLDLSVAAAPSTCWRSRAHRSPARALPWSGVEPTKGAYQLVRLRRPVPAAAGARDQAALGPDRRAVLRAGEPGRLRRGPQRAAPVAAVTTTSSPSSRSRRQALSQLCRVRGLERAQLPAVLGRAAGAG